MASMAKSKPRETENKPSDNDRHSPEVIRVTLRLHPLLSRQLAQLVDQNASDVNTEVRIAIREKLERIGLWPPPSEGKPASLAGGE